jgi:hypothetical protein
VTAESTGVEPVSPYGHQFSRLTHYRPAHSPTSIFYHLPVFARVNLAMLPKKTLRRRAAENRDEIFTRKLLSVFNLGICQVHLSPNKISHHFCQLGCSGFFSTDGFISALISNLSGIITTVSPSFDKCSSSLATFSR